MVLDRLLLRQIVRLGSPVVLGIISATTMGLISTAMVGRLGPSYLAAMGLATNLFNTVVRTTYALGQAVLALSARRLGAGREREVGEVVRVALTLGLMVGLVLTGLLELVAGPAMRLLAHQPELARIGAGYIAWRAPEALFLLLLFVHRGFFEGIGRTVVPMFIGLSTMLIDVFLNWCLIFGHLGFPRMEARGSGLASALATLCGALMLLALARRRGVRERFDLSLAPSLRRDILAPLWAVAWPGALRTFCVILSFTLFLSIVARLGTIELAASNGVMLICSFSFMPAIGVGTAVATLVGQSLGRSEPALARRTGWHGVVVSVAFMGVMGLLFVTAPRLCLHLFTDDRAILDAGAPVLRMMGLVQIFDAIGLTLAGAISGAGHTRLVMLADVTTAYLLFLPLTWLLALRLGHGLMGAWLAALLWFFAFAVLMVLGWTRGGWAKVRV